MTKMAMKTRHNRLHKLLHQETLDPQVADVIMRQKMSRENGEHPMDILQTGWSWRSCFLNWFFMLRNEHPILALLPRNVKWKNISTPFTRKYLNVPHTVPRCFREFNFDEKNPKVAACIKKIKARFVKAINVAPTASRAVATEVAWERRR